MKENRSRFAVGLCTSAFLLLLASCGDDGGGGPPAPPGDLVEVEGVVLDTKGEPVSGIPVEGVATGDLTRSLSDGFFAVEVSRDDPRIRVGGAFESAFVVRLDLSDGAAGVATLHLKAAGESSSSRKADELRGVARPFFVETFESGFSRAVPSGTQASSVLIDSPELPGLSIRIPAGTAVTYTEEDTGEVFLVGVANDRLPLAFPDGRLARMAVMVGPLGVRFSDAVPISLPNLDGQAPGVALDLAFLDPATGVWRLVQGIQVSSDGTVVSGGAIREGGIYAALPRVVWPVTTVRGRIIGSGSEPLPDYLILTQGGHSAASDEDGFFEIPDLPIWPGTEFRLQVLSPAGFRQEFKITGARAPVLEAAPPSAEEPDPAPETDFGIIPVSSVLRTSFPPSVSYSPGNGAGGVDEVTSIVVRFNRRMDLNTLGIQVVRGISREQRGIEGTTLLRLRPDSTEIEFRALDPLQNDTFYTIFIPKGATDLQGNVVDEDSVSSRFTVKPFRTEIGDQQLRVHSVTPNEAIVGDSVTILGENLNPETVQFGGVEAFVSEFDDTVRDFLVVKVPEGVAGEIPVSVMNLDGGFEGNLPFRARPLVAGIVPDADVALRIKGIGAHLGSSPTIFWNGIQGGSYAAIAKEECELEPDVRRTCFAVNLPAGVTSGTFFLEVDGISTEGFFAVAARPVDGEPPRVDPAGTSVPDGGTVAAGDTVVLPFVEFIDGASRVGVFSGGSALAGASQEVIHRASGVSEIAVAPPQGGWPAGAALRIDAGASIRDLAGNVLDQDPATPARDVFQLNFTAP